MSTLIFMYDLVSLLVGTSASIVVVLLYLKTRTKRLFAYLWTDAFIALIVVALAYDAYCTTMGYDSAIRQVVWASIQFSCCSLCICIPGLCHQEKRDKRSRTIDITFVVSAAMLIIALVVFYCFFGNRNSYYIVIYSLVYFELTLACLYFGLFHLQLSMPPARAGELRHYRRGLRSTGIAILVLLPLFIATDFYGWLIPFIAPHLGHNFALLPAFYTFMNLAILFGSARELLEPEAELESIETSKRFMAKYGLTQREAEVAPLVLRCLTYKQIGEKLFIAPGTVRTHLVHIFEKTGTHNRLELSALMQVERREAATIGSPAAPRHLLREPDGSGPRKSSILL